jgi:hypothetical protein
MNTCQATALGQVEARPHSVADWTEWFTPSRLALMLGLLLFAAYPEVILGTHSFFNNDFGLFTYPIAHYARESIWRGELPLWNPLSNCGLPFLAQWNTTVCYPLSWFYILFPLPWSLHCFCLGHLVLAGLSMYWLAHRWIGDRFAASLAGLAYSFNGFTLNCLIWTSILAAIAWLPLTILCVERAWRDGGRQILLAALVASMQMLSGAPELIFLTWFLLGTLLAVQVCSRSITARASSLRLGLVVALVCCLTAFQLFPFLQFARHCGRTPGWTNGAWAMPVWGWANFVVPLFRCSRSILGPCFQVEQQWTSSYYFGIGVVGLAFVGVSKAKNSRHWWLSAVALFGVLLALGENGLILPVLRRVFPALGLARYPIKFILATIFACPLLAALAINWIQRKAATAEAGRALPSAPQIVPRVLLWPGILLLALIAAITATAALFPYPDSSWHMTLRNGLERAPFLVFILGGIVLQTKTQNLSKRRWLGFGILMLLGLDILTHAPSQNPTVPNRAYGPLTLDMSAAPQPGQSRAMVSPRMQALLSQVSRPDPLVYYLGHRGSLYENCNLLESIPKVDGFFPIYPREAEAVQALLYTPTNFPAGLVDFLGTTQISSPDEFWKWLPRTTALPLATAGQQPVFAEADETLRTLAAPEFDPRRFVYLPTEARASLGVTNGSSAEITSSHFSAHQVALGVSAAQPALVVIAQSFFPCWGAAVDGHQAKLWRANHAFQAVEVPAGKHLVVLTYRDYWFYAGAVISGVTLLGCLIFAFWHVSCAKSASINRSPSQAEEL